ncbi:hypothetical protein ACHAXR_006696 [Thalassiosira sp. AJA248-18]
MASSNTTFPRPQNIIASIALVTSSVFYVSYRNHDRRTLFQEEVFTARGAIDSLLSTSTNINNASSTKTNKTEGSLATQHLYNLTKHGVTVVKDTLSPSQLVHWNKRTEAVFDNDDSVQNNIVWNCGRAYYSISKRSAGSQGNIHTCQNSVYYSDMARIGCSSEGDDDDYDNKDSSARNNSWLKSFWRRRSGSNNNSSRENDVASSQPTTISLQDIVRAYFQKHGIARYELTDVQFLNAYPKSTNQIWHRDNKFRGLTAIVALADVRANGPTELILGSHASNFSVWTKYWNVFQRCFQTTTNMSNQGTKNGNDSILLGCIDAGDTILYDARVFHRGRGHNSENDRKVLVLRWDATTTPPPGMGMIVTMTNKYVGCCMYGIIFALEKISKKSSGGK